MGLTPYGGVTWSLITEALPLLAAGFCAGYLIGSIPFAYVIVRGVTGEDVTAHGTGNVGAMNVKRTTGSWAWFTVAMVADALKGIVPAFLAKLWIASSSMDWALVVRPWGDTLVTRTALVAALSRDLTFEVGARLRAAVEIYGLHAGADGRVRYEVAYSLLKSSQAVSQIGRDSLERAAVLSFDRERPARGDMALDWVDIATDRIDPGRYLLRVDLLADGRRFGRAQAVVTLVASRER